MKGFVYNCVVKREKFHQFWKLWQNASIFSLTNNAIFVSVWKISFPGKNRRFILQSFNSQKVFKKWTKFEKMEPSKSIDNELVTQSLNYHGYQLTGFLKDLPEFRNLDLKNVDYSLHKSRSKEVRQEDRGRRLLHHRFITQNFRSLFRYDNITTLKCKVKLSKFSVQILLEMEFDL